MKDFTSRSRRVLNLQPGRRTTNFLVVKLYRQKSFWSSMLAESCFWVYSPPPMTTSLFEGPFLAVPVWASELVRERGLARDLQVLVSLVALMERRTKEVRASIVDIADYSRLSRETVKRSLKWLEDNEVLVVVRRKRPLTNSYRINYAPPNRLTGDPLTPSSGTLNRLTGEPLIGSLVSLSEGQNTYDDQVVHQTPIDILEISTKTVKRAASGEGEKMILGQDPEHVSKPTIKTPNKVLPKMNNLVNQFLSDPRTVMTSTYEMRDVIILRKTLNTLKGSGLTEFDLSQMIKRFMDVEHWRNADNPVLVFSNKEVQKKLMEQVDVAVVVDDPTLLWLTVDFDRTEVNPEWPEENDQAIKKLVIQEAMDICYRYPEVVAQCILNHGGSPGSALRDKLAALNSLVRVLAGDEEGDLQVVHSTAWQPDLPPELDKLLANKLRPKAGSIREAVYNYQRASHGKKK